MDFLEKKKKLGNSYRRKENLLEFSYSGVIPLPNWNIKPISTKIAYFSPHSILPKTLPLLYQGFHCKINNK